jgi:hypothetical protein
VLYAGALGAAGASLVSHWPWFAVCARPRRRRHGEGADSAPLSRALADNALNEALPTYDRRQEMAPYLVRNASIGFAASAVSDTVSNSIRVLKVTKQSSAVAISYPQALRQVVAKDGARGLFLRGLQTKILANGVQASLFSVLWRLGQDALGAKSERG